MNAKKIAIIVGSVAAVLAAASLAYIQLRKETVVEVDVELTAPDEIADPSER